MPIQPKTSKNSSLHDLDIMTLVMLITYLVSSTFEDIYLPGFCPWNCKTMASRVILSRINANLRAIFNKVSSRFEFQDWAKFSPLLHPIHLFLKNQVWKIKFDNLDFWPAKINFEIIVAGYTGSKNQIWNRLQI